MTVNARYFFTELKHKLKYMTTSEIRDLIITGSYMIGDGMIEPLNWKDYANKLEETLVKNNGVLPCVSKSLPSLDDATKVAVRISEEAITPPLDAKEQALFIAGFQECMKWLNVVFGNDR